MLLLLAWLNIRNCVRFEVDRAHSHLLHARRFSTFLRLENRDAILPLWFFQSNLLSKVTPRYITSFYWERAVPLYLNRVCIFLWAREKDWKAFFWYLSLYSFSHTILQALPVPCLVCILSFLPPFLYLPRFRRQGHLHIVNIWRQGWNLTHQLGRLYTG
jgi:hypothetical protein